MALAGCGHIDHFDDLRAESVGQLLAWCASSGWIRLVTRDGSPRGVGIGTHARTPARISVGYPYKIVRRIGEGEAPADSRPAPMTQFAQPPIVFLLPNLLSMSFRLT